MARPRGPSIPADDLRRRIEAVVDLVRRGASPELAAEAVGVSRQTWVLWRAKARAGEPEYAEVMAPILQAEAGFLCDVEIQMASEGRLLPGAWILERRRPGRYSLVAHLRQPDTDDAPTATDEDRIAGLLGRWEDSGAAAEIGDVGPIDVEFTSSGEADPDDGA